MGGGQKINFFVGVRGIKFEFWWGLRMDGWMDGMGWMGWMGYQKCPSIIFILCTNIKHVYIYLYR